MADKTKRPAPSGHAGSASRRTRLSPAALSRLAGDAAAPDLFGDELREARRASARSGAAIDRQYEGLKDDVRRKAKGRPNAYERGIRSVVKRIKY